MVRNISAVCAHRAERVLSRSHAVTDQTLLPYIYPRKIPQQFPLSPSVLKITASFNLSGHYWGVSACQHCDTSSLSFILWKALALWSYAQSGFRLFIWPDRQQGAMGLVLPLWLSVEQLHRTGRHYSCVYMTNLGSSNLIVCTREKGKSIFRSLDSYA